MTVFTRQTRIAVVLAAVSAIIVFSEITVLELVAVGVGAALILLGMTYSYRQPSAIGLLVVSAAAAASIDVTTLLEADILLMAIIGLLIPVSLLAWISLTVEEKEAIDELPAKRPLTIASIYGLFCLLSVPLVVLIVSVIGPGISMRIASMTEAAIMLITAIAGGILITMRSPVQIASAVASEETERTE
jgi:TRAP-type C4-dicarboxylate transport system permease small subunit